MKQVVMVVRQFDKSWESQTISVSRWPADIEQINEDQLEVQQCYQSIRF